MRRNGSGLVRDTLHQIAIAALRPNIETKQLKPRFVVPSREPPRSNRHPHAIPAPLPQWPGRGLHATRMLDLWMPRRAAAPLPEILDLLQRQRRLIQNLLSIRRQLTNSREMNH